MKKVYLCFALAAIALFAMAACGGGNGSKNGQNADEGQEFPIKVMGVYEYETWSHKYRDIYTYELQEDGMYSLDLKSEIARVQSEYDWHLREGYPKHFEGRWTVRYRTAGETTQKVYEIHRQEFGQFNAHSDYLPDDLEYIWIPSLHILEGIATWEECENFDTRNALKLQSPSDIQLYENVAVDENQQFPDPAFRALMLSNFDKDGDGIISDKEAMRITELRIVNRNITSLRGIQYFPNLKTLECCGNQQLTSLDLSQNQRLTKLYCYSNQLTSLDVSGCTELEVLNCGNNQLYSLDVSNNKALIELSCNNNHITSLDVSECTALVGLICDNNMLTSIDFSQNKALERLRCDNNQLTSLDLSQNQRLTRLYCYSNQLTSLDLSNNLQLNEFFCYSNPLSLINLGDSNFVRFNFADKKLEMSTNLKVISSKLKLFDIGKNNLQSLDVSECPALTALDCSSNELTILDVSGCTELAELYCYENNIASLNISNNKALKKLYCSWNQLASLDVSNNRGLNELDCSWNQLSSLDISKTNMNNGTLNCSDNPLKTLKIKKGFNIPGVTTNRNSNIVPQQAEIVFAN